MKEIKTKINNPELNTILLAESYDEAIEYLDKQIKELAESCDEVIEYLDKQIKEFDSNVKNFEDENKN